MLAPDFKEFIQLLNQHNAEYLVVGGYAVGYHGYPRYTGDLDIWLNPTESNAMKILKAIDDFGFASIGLTKTDLTKEVNIIQIGYPPLRIDLLTQIDGVSFDACNENKTIAIIDELAIPFISYGDLLKNKKASGRYRDLDDLENLSNG